MLQTENYLPGEGDQGRLKRGWFILSAGAGERKEREEAAMADRRGKSPSRGSCEGPYLALDTEIHCDHSSETRQVGWNLIVKVLFPTDKVLPLKGGWGHLKVFKQGGS